MRRLAAALLLTAFCAAPALAQQQGPAPAKTPAQAYQPETWPAASAVRVGVDPTRLEAPGFTRCSIRVDPRLGGAVVGFAEANRQEQANTPPDERPVAQVRLRVHKDARAARASLLGQLAFVQSRLVREKGLGDVAFGGRRDGRLGYALGVVGNVTYAVRALGKVDVATLAEATTRHITASAPLTRDQVVVPRLLSCRAEAVAGQPALLRLDFDPGAAAAAHLAFRCSEGAGVVQTKDGYELWAANPGAVTVQVFACSPTLQVGVSTHRFEVAPSAGR